MTDIRMNTFPVGSTVYVRWYGKVLQGEVIPSKGDDPLSRDMVHVLAPVQGVKVVTVFTPAHVYASPEEVPAASAATIPSSAPSGFAAGETATMPSPAGQATTALNAHRERYRQFKRDHWDHDHNRLRVEALPEFYTLFREGVAMRLALKRLQQPPTIAIDPAIPGGDRSATAIIGTHTNKAAPPPSVGLDTIETPKRKKTTPVQLSLNF